jgi:glycosyltransferase involved in cell wall biosynthesis
VTGEVPDTRPWLAAADVVVAPLALARGVQNKVLEAMAMGKAVVASTAAAEGIDAEVGAELLVAGTPQTQVAAIAALIADPLRAEAIGKAARDRVCARYSWAACLAPLAGLIA